MTTDKDKATDKKLIHDISYTYVTRPKVLCHSSNKIRNILRSGNVEKVEKLIREDYGYKLIGETSPFPKIKVLLKAVPFYMARIDMLHEAVVKGQLRDVQMLLNSTSPACSILKTKPENLVISKDSTGTGLLHKAVFYDYFDIVEWLATNFPATIHSRDKLGRIPLHYVNSTLDPDKVWDLLVTLGSDINAEDVLGKTPLYFLTNETEVQLPDKMQSPPKPFGSEANAIKPSNLRIWIHDQDINKLQQVIWDGLGDKLKTETSNKRLMKKFLSGVPLIMGVIQEIHKVVITNELNKLKVNSRNPIPAVILSSKDFRGVTPLHKAAGLGHDEIVNYILSRYPAAVHIHDNDGRTALHYAASFKKKNIYDQLIKFGANGNIIDKFGRTAKCYQSRQHDIDPYVLYEIPAAPRTGLATGYPSSWDWSILNVPNSMNNLNEKISSVESYHTKKKNNESSNILRVNSDDRRKLERNSYNRSNIENDNVPIIAEPLKTESILKAPSELETEDANDKTYENNNNTEPIIEGVEEFFQDVQEDRKNTSTLDLDSKSQIISEYSEQIAVDDTATGELSILHSEFNDVVDNYESVIKEKEFIDETILKKKLNFEHKVKEIIQQKNFDEMGNFIMQGCGEFFLNEKSSHSEVQEFINNLPIYLKKIELIHHCSEIGNLEELQKYLDRRKLAVVRENKTGLYLTPLHVAVINNHRDIARYLGGRFPETFKVVDKFGRTPLHFASVHPSGSYIYNMFLTLGADKNVKDWNDKTPEFYYQNKNADRFKQLLDAIKKSKRKFLNKTEEEIEEEAVSKPDENNKQNDKFDEPDKELLSGRLGTAIRTGLSAIASEKPSQPIQFLANYLSSYKEPAVTIDDESVPIIENTLPSSEHLEQDQLAEPQPEQRIIQETPLPEETPTIEIENDPHLPLDEEQELESISNEDNKKEEDENEFSEDEKKTSRDRKNSIINYKEEINNQFQAISRDKHGQSMLHFAAASRHSRNALLQTLQELDANIAQRDELYRTARDIAVFSQLYDNVRAIDAYVFNLAANGQTDKILQLLLDGYDHLLELETEENVMDVVKNRNHEKTLHILQTINIFEKIREDLHAAIRIGNKVRVREIFNKCGRDAKLMAICKNDASRCSLHISVLTQHKDIVKYIVKKYPKTIQIGDNLERTPLHYAMGLKSVEELSRILIEAGAARVVKDLKGRQPSYYFMNSAEILQIQQEEIFLSDQQNRVKSMAKIGH